MSHYLIAMVVPNPNEGEAIQEYSAKVSELLVSNGGNEAKRVKFSSSIKGESIFQMMLFMEFGDEQSINRVFESPAYKQLIPIRDRAFDKISIQIFENL